MKNNTILFCFIMLLLIISPIFLIIIHLKVQGQETEKEFFVGVEYAISDFNVEGCKALVDRVKNFTNFFVIDSLGITLDFNNLNEVSNYV